MLADIGDLLVTGGDSKYDVVDAVVADAGDGHPVELEEYRSGEPAETLVAVDERVVEQGLFIWPQWAAALDDEIARAPAAGDPDTGESFYDVWLAALERPVAESGAATVEDLPLTGEAWRRAAHRTPHGPPIEAITDDYPT